MSLGIAIALAANSARLGVLADEFNHRYSQGDEVYFYVHKVRLGWSGCLERIRHFVRM